MVKHTYYCDKCNAEFKDCFDRAYKLQNSISHAAPSKLITGDNIFEIILCPKCEKELLQWVGKGEYKEKFRKITHPTIFRIIYWL